MQGTLCSMCVLTGCSYCVSATQCTICQESYYLSGSDCMPCKFSCKSCSSVTSCRICNDGYYKGLTDCFECQFMCAICTNSTKCTKCVDGYFINNLLCTQCSDNCDLCNSLTDCTQCADGYRIVNGLCSQFLAHCLSFSTTMSDEAEPKPILTCTSCDPGYFLNSTSKCQRCKDNCMVCSTSSDCSKCVLGYFLSSLNTCTACFIGCKECDNIISCKTCFSINGYNAIYNPGYECKQCSNNCSSCSYDYCYKECPTGVVINVQIGEQCVSECAISGCRVCGLDGKCKECLSNFHLNSLKMCERCSSLCKECDSEGMCTSCYRGFYLTSQKNCLACNDGNCAICSDKYVCVECNSLYFLDNYECSPCHFGCLSCSSVTSCTKCASYLSSYAFYLDQNSCAQCSFGCYECSDALTCTKCKLAYYMSTSSSCQKCISGCLYCIDGQKCRTCDTGYYLEGDVCNACPTNCIKCLNNSVSIACSICSDGFSLTNNLCTLSCIDFCDVCLTVKDCSQCLTGYYMKNGTCRLCPPSRLNCTYSEFSKAISGECSKGYYYDSRSLGCNPIIILNCLSLDSSNTDCIECIAGYRLTFDGVCVAACVPNCLSCSVPYSCDVCFDEYDNIGNQECRLKCPSNCIDCMSNKTCTQCSPGYYMYEDQCIICIDSLCPIQCENITSFCFLCMTYYYFIKVDNTSTCNDCNINPLSRTPMEYQYKLCTGEFFDVDLNQLIGKGYSGNGTNMNDLCSMANPCKGVLPVGTYKISDILCDHNGNGSNRVLQLTPLTQFSTSDFYASFFSNLTIYAESISDDVNYTYSMGTFGIVADKTLRDQLTLGDTIEVIVDGCTISIDKCTTYPPPTIGDVLVTVSSTNQLDFVVANWGYAGVVFPIEYSVSMNISQTLIDICPASIITEFSCNINNSYQLGTFNTGGNFNITVRAKYKGAQSGLYSEYVTSVAIKSIPSISTPLASLKNAKQFKDKDGFTINAYYINSAINQLPGVSDIKSYIFEFNDTMNCTNSYCYNGGTCALQDNLRICLCLPKYTGMKCQIEVKALELIKEFNDKSSDNLILFDITSESDAIYSLDIANSLTSVAGGFSNVTYTNVLMIVNKSLEISTEKIVLEKVMQVLQNLLLSSVTEQYMSSTTNTTNRRLLSDNATVGITLNSLFNILNSYDSYLSRKAKDDSIGYQETLNIHGLNGLIFRTNGKFTKVNATANITDSVTLGIEIPHCLSNIMPNISKYAVEGNMMHLITYTVGSNSTKDNSSINISFSINNTEIKGKTSVYKCACYDGVSSLTFDNCKKAVLLGDMVTCSCKSPRVCMVVKKEAISQKRLIEIVVPVVVGAAVIAAVVVLIVLRKKIFARLRLRSTQGKSMLKEESNANTPKI